MKYFTKTPSFLMAIIVFPIFVSLTIAKEQPLVLSTHTSVTEEGKVNIHLTLKNSGQRTLYEIQPMIHFHHTMAMMSKIVQLEPGQRITVENNDHPDPACCFDHGVGDEVTKGGCLVA